MNVDLEKPVEGLFQSDGKTPVRYRDLMVDVLTNVPQGGVESADLVRRAVLVDRLRSDGGALEEGDRPLVIAALRSMRWAMVHAGVARFIAEVSAPVESAAAGV